MIYIDHHKWLVDNNILTEEMKTNIATLGYCLIEDTIESDTILDFENQTVTYKLVLGDKLYNNLILLKKYEDGGELGFFESRRLKKFLIKKKENDESGLGYRLEDIANSFIRAYFNNKWSAKVNFKSVKDDVKKDIQLPNEKDKQSH